MLNANDSMPLQKEGMNKKVNKTMPFKSKAQQGFMNANKKKIGAKIVNEFNQASKGMSLPAKASDHDGDETPKKKKSIGSRLMGGK